MQAMAKDVIPRDLYKRPRKLRSGLEQHCDVALAHVSYGSKADIRVARRRSNYGIVNRIALQLLDW